MTEESETSPSYGIVIDENTDLTNTIYPQTWATGDGTANNPWSNDCIQKAYNACPVGGTIYLEEGYYLLPDQFVVAKAINIVGEGRDKSNIILNIINEDGILVCADNVTLKGFTIDGSSQNKSQSSYTSVININEHSHATIENIEVKNGGCYGLNLYDQNYTTIKNVYLHDNYRHGFHAGSYTAGLNTHNNFSYIHAYNNGADGIDVYCSDPNRESYNTFDNISCWNNGGHGINLTGQGGAVLSDSEGRGNGDHGLHLYSMRNLDVNDCSFTTNDDAGILMESGCAGINFHTVIAKNNMQNPVAGWGGIRITDSNNTVFTSCQAYDDQDIKTQTYGIVIAGSSTGLSLSNCELTPNKNGDIYNPYNVAITTTEKMLAKN